MSGENGMYEVYSTGPKPATPAFRGTREAAERECGRRNKMDRDSPLYRGSWHVTTTSLIGAYPLGDPRYEK